MEVNGDVEVVRRKGLNPLVILFFPIIIFFVALFIPIIGLISSIIMGYLAIRDIEKHKLLNVATLILSMILFLNSLILFNVPRNVGKNPAVENNAISISGFDKNGSNTMTKYMIFPKEQVIGAGISPYTIPQGL